MNCADPAREIEAILSRGMGLDVRSIGASMVALAVHSRMKKRGIKKDAEYAGLAAASEAEFQALVEEIVVPETWFYRDRESFAVLGEWAAQEWLPTHPYDTLRLLSVPCSSGEEPYSIVMTLLEAGLPPERFSVEAVDISENALAKARRAVYSRNSFRGQPQEFRERYFQKTAEGWRLDEAVRSQVHFQQVNVLDPSFSRKEAGVDAIFCRNMLIYFDESSRTRLMTKLTAMLSPAGLLFLGHAEGSLGREFGFEPVPAPMAFAFRKMSPRAVAKPSPKRKPVAPPPPQPVLRTLLPPPIPSPAKPAPAAPPVTEAPETLLARAQKCADAGQFDAARAACETALRTHSASSHTYYLLALIEDAAGAEEEAEAFYRKTLYMEPDHYEALIQLSLLEQKRGDIKAARRLEERARRVRAKKEAQTR